jgi:internalin A
LKDLAGLKSLRELDISSSRVTDAGLKELAKLKGLRRLNLRRTEVTDTGLKELAALQDLRTLGLAEMDNVTEAGVVALRKLLPNAKINTTEVPSYGPP